MLTVTNFGLMFGHGIFVKYADVELGVTGFGYGLLLVATALGAAGAGVFGHRMIASPRDTVVDRRAVPRVRRHAGVDRRRSRSPAVVAVVGFVLGGSITLWNVVTLTIRQRVIEPARFGRVNSVYRWIGTGAGAFGALVGGQLAYATNSLRVPYLAAGVITLAALACSPRRSYAAPTTSTCDQARDLTPGAAVDDVGLAGDPARQVGGEEHRQVGDVLRLAEPLQRQCLGEVVTEVLDEVRREVGLAPGPARSRRPGWDRSRRPAGGSGGSTPPSSRCRRRGRTRRAARPPMRC